MSVYGDPVGHAPDSASQRSRVVRTMWTLCRQENVVTAPWPHGACRWPSWPKSHGSPSESLKLLSERVAATVADLTNCTCGFAVMVAILLRSRFAKSSSNLARLVHADRYLQRAKTPPGQRAFAPQPSGWAGEPRNPPMVRDVLITV